MISGFLDERSRQRYHDVYDSLLDWPVPSEDLTVETRFGPTYVRRSGAETGMPVVLLHGVLATSLSWQDCAAELGARNPVYAVDSIGEPGRSVQTEPMPDARSNADWLADVLAGLGHDRYHVAGVSRGGWLALNLALRDPGRVAGVTAFDPGGLDELGWRLRRWMVAGLAVMLAPAFIRRRFGPGSAYSAFTDPMHRRLVLAQLKHRTAVSALDRFTDDQWRSLAVPTTLVLAEHSPAHDSEEVRQRLRDLAPHVEVEIVPGTAHGMDLFTPERLSDRILRGTPES
ncbi:alpha/beta fold hydrolase [Prauserella flavalba]|uniref:AB hydrolase-1 domain-containing protein n=1 Tax=Prauserella flavalba TaxID=1477506 RepID=A0A318LMU1_9PSEU|nr:alpha/beta hydrolase [Prauserella flavalba]PXY35946.1 hypothetical protein BA062_10825 [Prauserella flavalba]